MNRMQKAWLITFVLSIQQISLVQAAELAAQLHWAHVVNMTAPVSGVISEINVDVGAEVDRNQVLLRLDPRRFQARLGQAEAKLVLAKEAKEEAKRELDRAQELFDRTVLSVHELQLVKIALTEAEAKFQAAYAQKVTAKLDLEQSVIRSPFAGIVIQRNAEVGQSAISEYPSEPLIQLASKLEMVAKASVDWKYFGNKSLGDVVRVKIQDQVFFGKLRSVALHSSASAMENGLYPIEVIFPTKGIKFIRLGPALILSE